MRIGLTVHVAVADTPGAAHALARHAPGAITVVPPKGTLDVLLPLPVSALQLKPQALAAAARRTSSGLRSASLAKMPQRR